MFELLTPNIDQDVAFFVSPLVTNPLKTPIAAHFVNFHWPTTPYNANMRIFSVAAARA